MVISEKSFEDLSNNEDFLFSELRKICLSKNFDLQINIHGAGSGCITIKTGPDLVYYVSFLTKEEYVNSLKVAVVTARIYKYGNKP